ncbi:MULTISPECIES: TIGR01244 family sulfur transferase [unclassified Marinobacterium]|jgi:sulfide:quinone oxidoreductase|uniref:TIGR01244 family sulfur transferase n=1 Tax=unclassified Marinobacterium TaxID=2644139 RepID=UPI00156A4A8A|nr:MULTISPECIES: TIGR01244 family sulfur transferase [unclassified Marinobacterium]NRP15745.1 Beta-lactamase hydrolase-like protein [Marinobacterium sp. xm-a-152]NRP27565.1 Beta-lactamase hydrolase-like protein [Marinobacterium sp. xm-d-420]NRP36076.1 Beta-lactamase hydrolase-like protein [Marinobacterium sp. xm-d-579]NRP47896.1 Beta-lactamase hydrolase-like protein [Marinobacterium sp. xm-d-543]NRP51731.1 Beta-lactamase hydrolase-like protein [Marinobacterium sp. xm-v-242]
MDVRKLTDSISVSPQVAIEDIKSIADAGFKTVICNRPNGESEDQPDLALIEAECQKLGLTYVSQPVISGNISDQDVEAFDQFLASAQTPIFAFCRTGTRCTMLWGMAEGSRQEAQAIIDKAANAGYDLNGIRARIEARQ